MAYRQARERKKHLSKLYEETKSSYGAGAWLNEEKGRYIKYSCHNKWLKLHCRRTTRRRMRHIPCEDTKHGKNNVYKKYYDYWWELL